MTATDDRPPTTPEPPQPPTAEKPKRDRTHWLYIGVIIAVVAGVAVGILAPGVGKDLGVLGTMFVSLIKMMIAPVIFCTIVLGIGSVRKAATVGKVGGMLAKLTYGASASEAEKHLKQALKLTPASPIAWIEYGNGLMLLHGDKREDEVAEAWDKAAKLKPRDAMEALDAGWAKEQLE